MVESTTRISSTRANPIGLAFGFMGFSWQYVAEIDDGRTAHGKYQPGEGWGRSQLVGRITHHLCRGLFAAALSVSFAAYVAYETAELVWLKFFRMGWGINRLED